MGEKGGAVAFFDVDGTLVWHDMEKARTSGADAVFSRPRPTDGVYGAFRRMRAAGHRTFICTGRHVPFIPDTLLDLGPDGVIAGAGTLSSPKGGAPAGRARSPTKNDRWHLP